MEEEALQTSTGLRSVDIPRQQGVGNKEDEKDRVSFANKNWKWMIGARTGSGCTTSRRTSRSSKKVNKKRQRGCKCLPERNRGEVS